MGQTAVDDGLHDAGIPALLLQELQGQTFITEGTAEARTHGDETARSGLPRLRTPRRTLKKANNAWNYRSQRNKLSHLIDVPTSHGKQAGTRDISFLYDHQSEVTTSQTNQMLRIESGGGAPEAPTTLIPEDYQIVRSERVAGLNIRPSNYSTHLAEGKASVDGSLRVFPSLHPNRRFEVKQLDSTFEAMMDELGIREPEAGPSQMHNLMEIVKKEQNIYDSIFYEIIRQVTVQCKERGHLLSKLRQRYADLMARIPRQINSLNNELIAQRELDKKLTSELLRFKESIRVLTKELSTVKKQDHEITEEAEKSKGELRIALEDAAKNSAILQEYHQLYELQRQRLEKQTRDLSFERDIWNSTSYSLGLKLIEENELTISRRLYVSERSWSKMGNHFAVLISEKDSVNLNDLQGHVNSWREIICDFSKTLQSQDDQSRNELANIRTQFDKWHNKLSTDFVYKDFTGSRRIHTPSAQAIQDMTEDLIEVKKSLQSFLLRFGDSTSLNLQADVTKLNELIQTSTDVAIEVYRRHRSMQGDKFPQHEIMSNVYETVTKLHNQLLCQITGENGVTSQIVQITNEISGWIIKLEKVGTAEAVDESDWLILLDKFVAWADVCDTLNDFLGSIKGLENGEKDVFIDDAVKMVSLWLHDTLTGIESENGKLSAMLTAVQNDLLKWMSSSLLLLVPDKSNNLVLRKIAIPSQVSATELLVQQEQLSQRCIDLTEYVAKCSHSVVTDQFSKSDAAEYTLLDQLKSFQNEAAEWEKSSQFLCESLQGAYQKSMQRLHERPLSSKTIKAPDSKTSEPVQDFEPPTESGPVVEKNDPKAKLSLSQVPLEKEDHVDGETVFILGENENISSRPVSRPPSGKLAEPLTAHSSQALQALNTVSQLQGELLVTEERAQTAEMKVEELEDRIRALERAMSRGQSLEEITPKEEEPVVQEEEVELTVVPSTTSTVAESLASENSAATSAGSSQESRRVKAKTGTKTPKNKKRKP